MESWIAGEHTSLAYRPVVAQRSISWCRPRGLRL